jgi:hypothetical protein
MVLTIDSIRVSGNPTILLKACVLDAFSKLCLYDPPPLPVPYHTMPCPTRAVVPVLLTYFHLQM